MLFGGINLDSKGFKQLLDTQSLVDCTLACDGGKISAHKIVLSACSSYLAKILFEHPVEHPIIILPELSIEDVRTLVHYMYTGELLKSSTLNSTSLLRTAAILSVNSLTDLATINDHQASKQLSSPLLNASPNSLVLPKLSLDNDNLQQQQQPQQYFGHSNISLLDYSSSTNTSNNSSISISSNNNNNNSHGQSIGHHLSQYHSTPTKSNEFQFKCPVCHNDFQTICSFEYHMQRIHNVTSFGCEICQKPFASLRYVLTDHMRRCHGLRAEQKAQHC